MSMPVMNLYFGHPDPPFKSIPDLQDFWSLEKIGIKDSPYTSDDDIALKLFNEHIIFENGRYHVAWPWISENPDLKEKITPKDYGWDDVLPQKFIDEFAAILQPIYLNSKHILFLVTLELTTPQMQNIHCYALLIDLQSHMQPAFI